jgi:hypothetical protein
MTKHFSIEYVVVACLVLSVIYCRRIVYQRCDTITPATSPANLLADVILSMDLLIVLNPFLMRWLFISIPIAPEVAAVLYMAILTIGVVWPIVIIRAEWRRVKRAR